MLISLHFVLRLRLIFFSVAASLVFLLKLMLNNLTITATLNQRILLKTATLNYFFVLRLRRTIIFCGSFAKEENFHIAATPFLSLVLWLRRTRIYRLLDLIQLPATPLLSSPVSCRIISITATPLYSCPQPLAVPRYIRSSRHLAHPKNGLEASHASKLTLCLAALERQTGSSGEAPLEKPPAQCPDIFSIYGESQAVKSPSPKAYFSSEIERHRTGLAADKIT